MANKPKESTVIERLAKKVNEAKNILTAIQFMELDKNFPAKLQEAITQYLNDTK